MKLDTKSRNAIDDKDFALPGRRYPVEDESHARNALSRIGQFGSPEEKSKVRAKVHSKYPDIGANDHDEDDKPKNMLAKLGRK